MIAPSEQEKRVQSCVLLLLLVVVVVVVPQRAAACGAAAPLLSSCLCASLVQACNMSLQHPPKLTASREPTSDTPAVYEQHHQQQQGRHNLHVKNVDD